MDAIQFELPAELWLFILSYIDESKSLLNIMKVSRLYNHLVNSEQEWKRRCGIRPLANLFQKSPEQPWKIFYYQPSVPLFPIFGLVIGQTDMEDLIRKGGIVGVPAAGYFRVGGLDIHTAKSAQQDPTGKKLVRGVMTRKPSELPKKWIELGLSWDKTFEEYKSSMWRYNKNYQITTLPANNTTFIGVIQSIAKHEDIYYSIELGFKGSLNEISIRAAPTLKYNYEYFYENKVIEEN